MILLLNSVSKAAKIGGSIGPAVPWVPHASWVSSVATV